MHRPAYRPRPPKFLAAAIASLFLLGTVNAATIALGSATGVSGGNGTNGTNSDGTTGGSGGNGGAGGCGGAGGLGYPGNTSTAGGGGSGGTSANGGNAIFDAGSNGRPFTASCNGSGAGGNSGGFDPTAGGGGGGGGGGAHGLVLNSSGNIYTVASGNTISGGNGGNAGDGGLGSVIENGGSGGRGGSGGTGISLSNGLRLENSGTIQGGSGGLGGIDKGCSSVGCTPSFDNSANRGSGGAGLTANSNSTIINSGSIIGGAGGTAATGAILTNSTLFNSGTLIGGNSSISGFLPANVGIQLSSNSTLTNYASGIISGGLIFDNSRSYAVYMTNGGNRVILEPGATLNGATTYDIFSASGATNGGDTLELTGSGAGNFNLGRIFGLKQLVKSGSSTWSVTGNTAGAAWTVSAGTLAIASTTGSELSSGSLTLSGGTLQTTNVAGTTISNALILSSDSILDNNGQNVTYAGAISGAGGMILNGTGTTTLSGANTATGGISVASGSTLNVNNGSAMGTGALQNSGAISLSNATQSVAGLSGNGSLTLNGTALTVTGSAANTYAGSITGTGSLLMNGSGSLTLNGNNTYSGGTTVSSGLLMIGDENNGAASLNGNVQVSAAATLRGHGTINGLVSNSGNVFPGGSLGILTVANYTQAPSGTLTLEVTPSVVPGTGYDQLQVTGTANLAGTLAINVGAGTFSTGSSYNLIHAGTAVNGTFSTINFTAPGFAAYIAPSVTYDAQNVFLVLNPLAPAFNTAQAWVDNKWAIGQSVLQALPATLEGRRAGKGLWLQGLSANAQVNTSTSNQSGAIFGYDLAGTTGTRFGLAFSHQTLDTRNGEQVVGSTLQNLSAYSAFENETLKALATVSYGHLDASTKRSLAPTNLTGQGQTQGKILSALANARYTFNLSRGYYFAPEVGLGVFKLNTKDFSETGAGSLNLEYADSSATVSQLKTGLRAGWAGEGFANSSFNAAIFAGNAAYSGDRTLQQNLTLAPTTQTLSVDTGRNATYWGVGATLGGHARDLFVDVNYTNMQSQNYQSHKVQLEARYAF